MRIFARIDGGLVIEKFPTEDFPTVDLPPDGDIRPMWHPDIVWVEVTGMSPLPEPGWSYSDGEFSEPKPHILSVEELLKKNTAQQESLQIIASQAITPLLLALQLGNATEDETSQARKWQSFSRSLKAVDLSSASPGWPSMPE